MQEPIKQTSLRQMKNTKTRVSLLRIALGGLGEAIEAGVGWCWHTSEVDLTEAGLRTQKAL